MTHRLFTAASAVALSLIASSVVAQDFRDLARQDLQAAHAALRDNHPAAVIPGAASEDFRAWLDAGLADALSKVGQVNSGDSHAYLMRYYGAGFRDSNITLRPTFEGLGPYFATNWPGYTTGWRDGQYVVTWVKPGTRGAPAVGAVVTECNAQPIEEYARGKLDLWEGDLDTEAGRVRSAPIFCGTATTPSPEACPRPANSRSETAVPATWKFAPSRSTPPRWSRLTAPPSICPVTFPCRSRRSMVARG